ncbi:MAG: hypothetical protein Q8N96_15030 [Methylovulum sp.]|nr:hypothetical protein [Methylovulum sp.]
MIELTEIEQAALSGKPTATARKAIDKAKKPPKPSKRLLKPKIGRD